MVTRHPAFDASWRLAVRWILIGAATVLGFWKTWQDVWFSAAEGTAIGYVFVVPFLCITAAIGISLRRNKELPIHDRQTDKIVGGIGLLVSLGIRMLLMPRYAENYQLMHLDVVAAWVFLFSAAVLVFGLRSVSRFWPVWLLGIGLFPLPYRTLGVLLGGNRFAFGIIMVVLASGAAAIAVNRSNRRAVTGFAASVLLGTIALYLTVQRFPTAPLFVVQLGPALGSAILVGIAFYVYTRRGGPMTPLDRPVRRPTTPTSGLTTVAVFAVALVMFMPPLPDQNLTPVSPGPPPSAATGILVPGGWEQHAVTEYSWPRRYFGVTSELTRQTIRTTEPNPAWDTQNRNRTVQVDVLSVRRPSTLEVYPSQTMYELENARVSPKVAIDIGRGVVAEMYTIVDDDLLLTWSNLNFVWVRSPELTQRITLVSVDNHEPDAQFPEPAPSMATNGANTLAVLLRGQNAVSDTEPEYKDRDMLVTLAREIVKEQQW
ncbi:hypothetical protein ACH47B_20130 [Rhodococcus sp. NPDC019627]|uniref:hypothetical protein n=1 Tax=unclassified Rhodococcus (in: high G+C Gram-positive bacteria) TaxID=192944 RepID=UPI0033FCE40B